MAQRGMFWILVAIRILSWILDQIQGLFTISFAVYPTNVSTGFHEIFCSGVQQLELKRRPRHDLIYSL